MTETITKNYDVKNFSVLHIGGPGQVFLSQGDVESLSIEAPESVFENVEVENENEKLSIRFRVSSLFSWVFGGLLEPKDEITYRIVAKDLTQVGFGGSLRVEISPFSTQDLKIENSGSVKAKIADLNIQGTLKISNSGSVHATFANVNTQSLEISTSGSVHVEFGDLQAENLSAGASGSMKFAAQSGKVHQQTIRISGSGTYNALQLQSAVTKIHISGSGDAKVWADESLDVHVSGSGSVQYRGNGNVSQRVSGSGKVKKVDPVEG